MFIECPHCGKKLKAGEKFAQKLAELNDGDTLGVKCVSCSQAFPVDKSLLDKQVQKSPQQVRPPAPPDVSWIVDGLEDEDETDRLLAIVLVKDPELRHLVEQTLSAFGYLLEFAESPVEALEKMQFVRYAAVVLSSDYQKEPLAHSAVHSAIIEKGMSWRREAIYLLIGDEFNTMYDLQALVLSANAVINTSDVKYLPAIYQKVSRDHKELFGPLIQEMDRGDR